jgi:aminomethyltransferase
MKYTALTSVHQELGAKMIAFAGYYMPLSYTGIQDEHIAVRNTVGIFDVSHMGQLMISGEGAIHLLQFVTSNDVAKLTNGKAQYSCMTNDTGGIVDDLLVYKFSDTKYMLVVNASNIEKDYNWLLKHNTFGAEVNDISEQTSLLALQGPKAQATLQKLTTVNLVAVPYYSFTEGVVAGIPNVIISNTGYTGAGGFELYFPNEYARTIWFAILEAGKEFGIKPAGLGARDTLRLEKGYCLYGNDIDETTSPIEAGLGWIIKFNKNFVGRAVIEKQKNEGVSRKLIGFVMIEKGIPRLGYLIQDAAGNEIGRVTSGTQSPSLQKAIGMGYVNTAFSLPGTEIWIYIRNTPVKAKVVKLPFL